MAEQLTIDVEPRHLKMVQAVFARHLPFKQVWAYGSRVKWNARKTSDLDCVVFGATDSEIYKAQEAFDESDIPFEVQLLNWETIPADFKENIKKHYFVMRKESDWGESKLINLTIKIGSGATPTGGKGAYHDKGLSLIRSLNVHDFSFTEKDLALINQEQAKKLKNVEVMENDVLLNITGASVARCCIVPKHILPARVNQHVSIIRANEKVLNYAFLHYVLVSPYYKSRLLSISQGGSTREALTKDFIENFQISYPPLSVQKKIAGVLSAYDDLIENNNKRIKILEDMAQKIYKEWFVDFRFPNHENTKFIESELGNIPEGWEVVSLGSKIHIKKGKNITKETITEGNIPVVAGGLNPAYYHNKANAKAPVITISASGANAGYINLYYQDIWASDCSYINSDTTDFVYFYYILLLSKQQEVTALQRGSAQPHVYPKDLMELLIYDIPDSIIKPFEEEIRAIFNFIDNLNKKNNNLKQTRDMLLPMLISGELSVEGLEIISDEEA